MTNDYFEIEVYTNKKRRHYYSLLQVLEVFKNQEKIYLESYLFKNDFSKRPDAVEELIYRCLQVVTISEYLFSAQFISTEKYLEIADRLEKIGVTKSQRNYSC